MQVVWITDPHLNFLPAGGSEAFGIDVAKNHPDSDLMVISGDIAEAPTVRNCLNDLARGYGKKIAFTLGNHDYYYGSFESVRKEMAESLTDNLVWLDAAEPILLDDATAIVGHEGWFDGHYGDPIKSRVVMSDFEIIRDLRKHWDKFGWAYGGPRDELLAVLKQLGQQAADTARPRLRAALEQRENVLFVTHFPPFDKACWHRGAVSDRHWLPWFTCRAMGDMLLDVAGQYPDRRIQVLCGHTHSPGVYQPLPNLKVLTGKSVYGSPRVHAVLTTPFDWPKV